MRPLEQCILDRRDQSKDVWPVPYLENIIAYQRKHLIPALVCHIKTMLALLHNINSCHVGFFFYFSCCLVAPSLVSLLVLNMKSTTECLKKKILKNQIVAIVVK